MCSVVPCDYWAGQTASMATLNQCLITQLQKRRRCCEQVRQHHLAAWSEMKGWTTSCVTVFMYFEGIRIKLIAWMIMNNVRSSDYDLTLFIISQGEIICEARVENQISSPLNKPSWWCRPFECPHLIQLEHQQTIPTGWSRSSSLLQVAFLFPLNWKAAAVSCAAQRSCLSLTFTELHVRLEPHTSETRSQIPWPGKINPFTWCSGLICATWVSFARFLPRAAVKRS